MQPSTRILVAVLFGATLASATLGACDKNGAAQTTPTQDSSDKAPAAAEPEPEPAPAASQSTAQAQPHGQACPMLVEGVVVGTSDTPDGIALDFTTASGDVEDLRARVEHMAKMYEMHAGHGSMMWQHKGHMRAEGDQPGMGSSMPAASAKSEPIDDGARLVLTPLDPAKLEALREQVRDHQKHMSANECWMPSAGAGD